MSTDSDYQAAFRRRRDGSREYEQLVGAFFRARGFYTVWLPSCGDVPADIPTVRAPHGHASIGQPDLLCFRPVEPHKTTWVEVKVKRTLTRDGETGFKTRDLKDYRLLEDVSGLPVYIVFVHVDRAEVKGAWLSHLTSTVVRTWEGTGRQGGHYNDPMTYWSYQALPRLCSLQVLEGFRQG